MKFAEFFCFWVFTASMGFFFYIMHQSFNKQNVDLPSEVDQIMIAVIGISGSVVGYVVGSSKASSDKDKVIADLGSQQPIIIPPIRAHDAVYKIIDSLKDLTQLNQLYTTFSAEISSDKVLKSYLDNAISLLTKK